MHLSDDTKEFIEARLERFPRYFERINQVQVTASPENEEVDVEIVVHPPGGTLVVHERAGDLHVAIDGAADKMERKLVRLKEKLSAHRAKRPETPVTPGEEEEEEAYDDIIDSLLEEESE